MARFPKSLFVLFALTLVLASCKGGSDHTDEDDLFTEISGDVNAPLEFDEPEEFTVSPDELMVETDNYSIKFTSTVITGETELQVRRATQAPCLYDEGEKAVVYDFSLGDLHDLKGVAEIRIPMEIEEGEGKPVAVYYNEETKAWEMTRYDYDEEAQEFIITTDHLTTFGAYVVNRAYSRFATIQYEYAYHSDPEYFKFTADLAELLSSDAVLFDACDWAAQKYSDASQIGIDIGYNIIKAGGYTQPFIEKYGNLLSSVGIAVSFYQSMRCLCHDRDYAKHAGVGMKSWLNLGLSKFGNFIGTSAMYCGMAAVGIIDYSLTKFAETAWTGRKDMYKKAYDLYYSEAGEGYRTDQQWYDLFWPAFTKKGMTEDRLTALIDAYVRKYCEQFWENENTVAYYLQEANPNMTFTGGGGLNYKIQSDLANELRGKLYNTVLPSVIESIGEKMTNRQFDVMKDRMMRYAHEMNKRVTLQFYDRYPLSNGNSSYEGYTVQFQELPLVIKDPKNWECRLDKKGNGKIEFTLFAYAVTGVPHYMKIIDPTGKVVQEFPIEVEPGVVKIGYEPEANYNTELGNDWYTGPNGTICFKKEDDGTNSVSYYYKESGTMGNTALKGSYLNEKGKIIVTPKEISQSINGTRMPFADMKLGEPATINYRINGWLLTIQYGQYSEQMWRNIRDFVIPLYTEDESYCLDMRQHRSFSLTCRDTDRKDGSLSLLEGNCLYDDHTIQLQVTRVAYFPKPEKEDETRSRQQPQIELVQAETDSGDEEEAPASQIQSGTTLNIPYTYTNGRLKFSVGGKTFVFMKRKS